MDNCHSALHELPNKGVGEGGDVDQKCGWTCVAKTSKALPLLRQWNHFNRFIFSVSTTQLRSKIKAFMDIEQRLRMREL